MNKVKRCYATNSVKLCKIKRIIQLDANASLLTITLYKLDIWHIRQLYDENTSSLKCSRLIHQGMQISVQIFTTINVQFVIFFFLQEPKFNILPVAWLITMSPPKYKLVAFICLYNCFLSGLDQKCKHCSCLGVSGSCLCLITQIYFLFRVTSVVVYPIVIHSIYQIAIVCHTLMCIIIILLVT